MKNSEWPLIGFTLLAQAAIGAFLILLIERAWLANYLPANSFKIFTLSVLFIVLLILSIGAVAAAQHLGHPRRAVRAIKNLQSSWLSREMLLGGLFGLGVGLYAVLIWQEIDNYTFLTTIGVISAFTGVAFVYAIARLYMLRTVPAWNNVATPLTFFATTFLLGGVIVIGTLLVTFTFPSQALMATPVLFSIKRIATLICFTLLLQIVIEFFKINYLRSSSGAAKQSANIIIGTYRHLLTARLALACVGIAAMLSAICQSNAGIVYPMLLFAFLTIWTSEIIGRFLFYASYQRVGL